jgi:hypothetical protein
VRHRERAVPLRGVAVEEEPQRGARELVERGQLLEVDGQLEGDEAEE